MRTTVKFTLDDPSRKKWDKYMSLIPYIDDIMRDHNVNLLTRSTEEADYSIEECFDYLNEEVHQHMIMRLTNFTHSHDLFFTLLKKTEDLSPKGFKTTMKVRLRSGYRNQKMWNKWLEKSKSVKESAMFYGVHVVRELDIKNYTVRMQAYYKNPADFASAFFSAGWMYGRSNIPLEVTDVFQETYQMDLLEDMQEITKQMKRRKI